MKGFWGAFFGFILWVAVTPFAVVGFLLLRTEKLIDDIKKEMKNAR